MNQVFKLLSKLFFFGLLMLFLVMIAMVYYIQYELPDIQALKTVQLQVPLQIYTQDGKLISTFGENRRIPVPYSQIPKPLINAVLATEDQRYFSHSGVDLPGLGRATVQLLLTGRKSQGGSTITMQVARSFYLSRNKTFSRKLREILLAIKIEHTLSKEKILELYLNKVFFGNRAYGVSAAAEIYYGKPLNTLSLDQLATIAGLPKAPSTLNPIINPEASKKRRDHVLGRMFEQHYINKDEYVAALAAPMNATYHDLPSEIKAPYAAELAREQLEQMYGESIYTDGYKAYTTIDSQTQIAANISTRDNLLAYDKRHGYRGTAKNIGATGLNEIAEIEKTLQKIPVISGIEAAVVVDSSAKGITVVRANGELTPIAWSGMVWARKQINENYLGRKPKTANEIVKLGDIVRIEKNGSAYQLSQLPRAETSLVAMHPINGAILAMVGGFDYQLSKFNRVTNAQRQPGSSFKPFIYSAALEKGYTLASVINDAPIVIANPTDNSLWRPQNDTRKFYGATRLHTAIMESRNLVSIRLLALMDMPYTIDYLKRFGFTDAQLPRGLSLALGTALVTPLQMAQAFSVFANNGYRVTPYLIDSVKNSHDEVVYQAIPLVACETNCDPGISPAPRVISAANAFLITSTLQDVIQHGTATFAKKLGRKDIAGKTGTTQNEVDAWFAGYTPDIVTIAWVGFNHPQSLHEYGAQAALPLWTDFMERILKDKPERAFEVPEDIVSVRIDPVTGKRAAENDPLAISEYFTKESLPKEEAEPDIDVYDGDKNNKKEIPVSVNNSPTQEAPVNDQPELVY